MKSPAGRTRPAAKKRVRLDLRRAAPPPAPDDEIGNRQRSHFWMWFGVVALFHFVLLVVVLYFYHSAATPTPPEQFILLVPQGDVVKGTPGAQASVKVGASTPAPSHPHHIPKPPRPQPVPPTPPPPTETAVQPRPEKVHSKPVIHEENAPSLAETKLKPAPPKPKKIKVDLTLAEGPAPEKPVTKPKHVHKTPPPAEERHDDEPDRNVTADTMGLSKEQVAEQLGKKLDAAGVANATKYGKSGAADGHDNKFGDFYQSISDQITNKWQLPNQDSANATNPVVRIHVEKDGRVAPESVVLLRSSGNQAIDDSALSAARSIGYTLQPLPDGCPPDISINLNLAH